MNSHLIIRTCRHLLPEGRRCQGAAVRGRSCCRHHLHTRARLHNMARARRLICIPRLRVPETLRDLAVNQFEVRRILATGRVDPASAKTMARAMQLCAASLRLELDSRWRQAHIRASNSNKIYQVQLNHVFSRGYAKNRSEVIENTRRRGRGVSPNDFAKRE